MKDNIRQAFDQVHADPALKARTRAFVAAQTQPRLARPARRLPQVLAAAACLLVLLAGSCWIYFFPTARISIDINPSIELSVNRFDRVVGVEGWNEDGQALAETLDIQFDTYTQAVEAILADQKIAALLAEGGVMDITVVAPQNDQCSRMLTDLETCTAGHRNTRCHTAQPQELEEAHDLGLSCGKYRAYLELYALDPSITPQQVGSMTMREIRDLLAQLENGAGSSAASSSSAAAGQGHGHHHGYGHQ